MPYKTLLACLLLTCTLAAQAAAPKPQQAAVATAHPAATVAGLETLAAGGFFCLGGALGLVRFPDVLARMHAATKPQVFGLILVLGGVTLTLRSVHVTLVCLVIVALQILTAPVAGHMVARTAYRIGAWNADGAVVDATVARARVRSRRRYSYDEVQALIDGGQAGDGHRHCLDRQQRLRMQQALNGLHHQPQGACTEEECAGVGRQVADLAAAQA